MLGVFLYPIGYNGNSATRVFPWRFVEIHGAYRVIYIARRVEAVYVLHAFQKKTQATQKKDLEIARRRFRSLQGGRI